MGRSGRAMMKQGRRRIDTRKAVLAMSIRTGSSFQGPSARTRGGTAAVRRRGAGIPAPPHPVHTAAGPSPATLGIPRPAPSAGLPRSLVPAASLEL